MSIVKMRRLRVLALDADRGALLDDLMRLGCVEITAPAVGPEDPDWAPLVRRGERSDAEVRSRIAAVNAALDALKKYAPAKKGLFTIRSDVSEAAFLAADTEAALEKAEAIGAHARGIAALQTEQGRFASRRASLAPWAALDLPLDTPSTKKLVVQFGVCPASRSIEELTELLRGATEYAELYHAHSDREQHYLLLYCLADDFDAAAEALKPAGWSRVSFKDTEGTASECVAAIDRRLVETTAEIETHTQRIAALAEDRAALELAADRLSLELAKAEAGGELLVTDKALMLEGWISAPDEQAMSDTLGKYACAFELADPEADDQVPTKLQNTALIRPFNMVTEMFSLPAYHGIDPNPLMAPFFAVFFGIMYADLAYGLILLAISLVVTNRVKPRGTMGYLFRLMGICGVTSAFFGVLFGGFFSDGLGAFTETFLGSRIDFPALWFNPLEDPMTMLIFAIGLGAVQVLFGMGIKFYMLCREGKLLDALMDVGSWWLLFAGIAVLALGGTYWVALAGVAALLLTQGRAAPTVVGKIMGGLGSLYDITSYLSDLLSYARLMALCLAGAVIGQVFNILGTLGGGSVVGFILFVVVFIAGHAFNMGINIIGTYVHAARLQYLEFFNKFFVGDGKPFRPLAINTKYVNVLKEEK